MGMIETITIENHSKILNKRSIMVMCCMAMSCLPGMGGPPM